MLSPDDVIRKKYLVDDGCRCGYLSGMMFANQLGITTQVPVVYEVYTNKATTDYRDTTIGSQRIIIRRPYVEINDGNASILQFLDLMKEVRDIAEIVKANDLRFDILKQYFPYYPDRLYRNMYEVGLLNGVFT